MDNIDIVITCVLVIGVFFAVFPSQAEQTGNFLSKIAFTSCGNTNGLYPASIPFGGGSGSCSFPGNSGVYLKVNVPSAQSITVNPNIQSTGSCQTAIHTGPDGVDMPFKWENNAPWQVTFSAQPGWYTIVVMCVQGGSYNVQVTGSGGQQQQPQTGGEEGNFNQGTTTNSFATSSGGSVPTAMADRSSSTFFLIFGICLQSLSIINIFIVK